MILETEYLYLKAMRQDDFNDLKMMLQDPDVMYAYEHNFSDADVQSWLDRNIKRYKDFGFGLWGMYLKETDEFIGNAGLSMQDTDVEQVIEIGYLIKKEFFDNPILRPLLLKLGGIPVDRSRGNNIVNQVAAMFEKYDDLNIIITPEGTRKLVNNWKRGFYYIAQKANVPIVLGFLDFKKKELGFGPMLYPTGNYEEDWKEMEKFYRGINAKHPERYNLSK